MKHGGVQREREEGVASKRNALKKEFSESENDLKSLVKNVKSFIKIKKEKRFF